MWRRDARDGGEHGGVRTRTGDGNSGKQTAWRSGGMLMAGGASTLGQGGRAQCCDGREGQASHGRAVVANFGAEHAHERKKGEAQHRASETVTQEWEGVTKDVRWWPASAS